METFKVKSGVKKGEGGNNRNKQKQGKTKKIETKQ